MPDDTKIYNELSRLRHDAQTLGVYEIHELDVKSWVTGCLEHLKYIVGAARARRKLSEHKNAVNSIIGAMHTAREKRAEEFDRILLSKFKEGAVVPVGSDVVTVTNRKQAEELFGVGSWLVDLFKPAPLTYQNSCKVDKIEHGRGVVDNLGTVWHFYDNIDSGGYTIIESQPTRKVETDNTAGTADSKCNPSGHDVTNVYIRGLGDAAYYNPGPTTNVNGCLPNGSIPNGSIPNRHRGLTANKSGYDPPSGIAREGHVAVGVWVNHMPSREIRNAKCSNTEAGIDGKDVGKWDSLSTLTLGGIPFPKPLGRAFHKIKAGETGMIGIDGFGPERVTVNRTVLAGELVTSDDYYKAVESTNSDTGGHRLITAYNINLDTSQIYSINVPFLNRCRGCSFAKWPNAGPGYSERCDKCKLSSARPDYEPKAAK